MIDEGTVWTPLDEANRFRVSRLYEIITRLSMLVNRFLFRGDNTAVKLFFPLLETRVPLKNHPLNIIIPNDDGEQDAVDTV